nr:hypothetical protein [Tanacetum cinerariifolium]
LGVLAGKRGAGERDVRQAPGEHASGQMQPGRFQEGEALFAMQARAVDAGHQRGDVVDQRDHRPAQVELHVAVEGVRGGN